MSRLTEKDNTFCFPSSGCNLQYVGIKPLRFDINDKNIDFIESFINKLGQLEDIEDELGLTLKQFFKEITKINPNWTTLYFKYNGKEYEIKERE